MDEAVYAALKGAAQSGALLTLAEVARQVGRSPGTDATTIYLHQALETIVRYDAARNRPLLSLLVTVPLGTEPLGRLRLVCADVGAYNGGAGNADAWSTFAQEERTRVYAVYQRRC